MKKRIMAMCLCLMLAVTALSACGNGNTEKKETTEEGKKESNDDAKEKSGGTLTIGIAGAVQNLDPYMINTGNANYILNQLAETLVRLNDDGTMEPHLATEWEISPDGMEYVFTIRDDVHFHPGKFQDGRLMTAEDVAWNLNRCIDNYTGYMNMLEKAEAVDETHVKCTLVAPSSLFLLNLRQNLCAIVPPEEVEGQGDAFNQNVIATGPFMLESHDPDVGTTMVANPNYWGGKPNVDKVVIKVIPDLNQRLYALQNGEIDYAGNISGEAIKTLEETDGCNVYKKYVPFFTTIGMNTRNEILKDERVREAIIMATDYDTLFKGTYLYEEAVPTRVMIPKESWAYSEKLEDYIPSYDPEKAKELLADAGYPDGFHIKVSMGQGANLERAMTLFQQMMKENLNIDVEFEYLEAAAKIEKMMNGTCEMWAGNQYYEMDPANFYGLSFATSQLESNYNAWKFSDPKVDELIEEAGKLTDQDERLKLYDQIAEIVLPQDFAIWFAAEAVVTGYTDRVHDFNVGLGGLYLYGDGQHAWVQD